MSESNPRDLIDPAGPGRRRDPWAEMEAVLRRIRPPVFPARDFPITDYGAVGDGRADARAALARAIDRCNAAGGGRVVIPAGTWRMNGPILLKSNVHLYVAEGATVRFDPDPDCYLPVVLTRWEGTELFNYSPQVYAYQATNVAITGGGTLDGRAQESFATWRPHQQEAQLRLRRMGAEGVPLHERLFGEGHWLRPSMIQFFGCKNVLVDGLTLRDAPFWVVHPVYCENVTVRDLHVDSWNPNNDGVDPDSCMDVLIEHCRFDTGDDSVAIKSGRDGDGWRVGQASANVVVRNCDLNSRANALCIGSEMSAGVRNVFIEACRVGKARSAVCFKANLDRGGAVEHVRVRGVTAAETRTLIHFATDYHGYRGSHHPPAFRDILVEDVACGSTCTALDAVGLPEAPLRDVMLRRVDVRQAAEPNVIRHVEGLVLEEVTINGARCDAVLSAG